MTATDNDTLMPCPFCGGTACLHNENQKRAVPATLDEAKAAGLENEWWAAYCEARGG
jgi:hypothetical protein